MVTNKAVIAPVVDSVITPRVFAVASQASMELDVNIKLYWDK